MDDFYPPFPSKFLPAPAPAPVPPRPLFVDVNRPPPSGYIDGSRRLYGRRGPVYHKPAARTTVKRPVSNPPQRTTSADDFRTTTQPKYVPRPIFVDVTAPLGPRPNLGGGSNPLASQKTRVVVGGKAPAQNHAHAQKYGAAKNVAPAQKHGHLKNIAPAPNPPTSTSSTQVRFGQGVSISSSQANSSKSTPPPAHAQKPSVSIIPHQSASAKHNSNVAVVKPPPPRILPKLVQNPLNLTKKMNGGNVGNAFIVNRKEAPPTNKPPPKIVKLPPSQKVYPPPLARLAATTTAPPHLARMTTTTAATLTAPQTSKVVAVASPQVVKRALAGSTPHRAVVGSTAAPVSIIQGSTIESAPATLQQSPLQKQIRGFMDHLHRLQQSMRNGNTVIPATITKDSNTTPTPLIVNKPSPSVPKNLVPNPVVPHTVVRVGPRNLSPVIGGKKKGGAAPIMGLNAARNLSNLPKTYQRTKNNGVAGGSNRMPTLDSPTLTSQNVIPPAPPPPPSTNRPVVRMIGSFPNSHTPQGYGTTASRVTVPNNIQNRVGIVNNGPGILGKAPPMGNGSRPLVVTPVGVVNNGSGQRVVPGAGHVYGATPRVVQKGNKKIVISPIQNHNTPTVRVDQLQKKLWTNMNKSYAGAPKPNNLPKEAPRNSFNNGTNVVTKTYQNQSHKGYSPLRTSSMPSLSLSQPTISVSKSNKENRSRRRLSLKTNNNSGGNPTLVDLSNEEDGDGSGVAGSSLSQDMVSTLRKKGVSINYLGKGNEKDVISLD